MPEFPRIHQPGEKLAEGVFYLPDQRRAIIFAADLKAETDRLGEPHCETAAVLAAVNAVLSIPCTAEATSIKIFLPVDGPLCSAGMPLCPGCKKGVRR